MLSAQCTPGDYSDHDSAGRPASRSVSLLAAFLLALSSCSDPGSPPEPSRPAAWRLAESTSPYLRAHADNPVAWYPWGEQAFARARELDRPVLLSIGYSTCHWCHVMERTTFQDPECARQLNESFVAIKVDREERPDIDARYLRALHLLTGTGGWPANLFLTPDGEPFAGGTYFPPRAEEGQLAFPDVLDRILTAWTSDREAVLSTASQVGRVLSSDHLPPATALDPERLLGEATTSIFASLDTEQGGTHGAPKFPPSLALRFLLRRHVRQGADVLPSVGVSLDAMLSGGLRDHIGGGFHRYTVDAEWRLPHFEKMLDDNALLLLTYAEAGQLAGVERWGDEARAIFDFLQRELRTDAGLYACALDADSRAPEDPQGPGQEGRFYTWTRDELQTALGATDAVRFGAIYASTEETLDLTDGRLVLQPRAILDSFAPPGSLERASFLNWHAQMLATLRATRAQRPRPARDDQCKLGSNGLLLSALCRAGGLLGNEDFLAAARKLVAALRTAPGFRPQSLPHLWIDGAAVGKATLFDHAALGLGLLDAAAAWNEPALLVEAAAVTRQLILRFAHDDGSFYDTDGEDALLPGRGREIQDGAVASGSSLTLELLLRLAPLDPSGRIGGLADRALARLGPLSELGPVAFISLLSALDLAQGPLADSRLDFPALEAAKLPEAVLAQVQALLGAD